MAGRLRESDITARHSIRQPCWADSPTTRPFAVEGLRSRFDMEAPTPRYLDFAKWRIRRSSLDIVKSVRFMEPLRPGGPTVFFEMRGFASGLQFPGKQWALASWWSQTEKGGALQDLEDCGLDSRDVLLSPRRP